MHYANFSPLPVRLIASDEPGEPLFPGDPLTPALLPMRSLFLEHVALGRANRFLIAVVLGEYLPLDIRTGDESIVSLDHPPAPGRLLLAQNHSGDLVIVPFTEELPLHTVFGVMTGLWRRFDNPERVLRKQLPYL